MRKAVDLSLIEQAQAGQKQALSALSQLAREKVYLFVYRLTLDSHLAEDLAQETLLDMVKSKSKLSFKHVNAFWAWLHRTALGKVQHHFRLQGNRRIQARTTLGSEHLDHVSAPERAGVDQLVDDERRRSVFEAMDALSLAYRSVLTLRCFERMSYAQIAAVTGQTELQARVRFFRAKQSLKRQLLSKGLGREHFLAALTLFATVTAGSVRKVSAATVVHESALAVGGPAVCLALLTSKVGIIVTTLLLTGSVVTGQLLSRPRGRREGPRDASLRQAYNTFANPQRLVAAFDAGGRGWRAAVGQPTTQTFARAQLETALTRDSAEATQTLALPAGAWVHVAFAGAIVDGQGADILVDAQRFNQQPRVFVTDGGAREVPLTRTIALPTSGGFDLSGYDLQDAEIPFEPIGVRLEGCGTPEADCLGLWVIKARIGADI